MQCTVISTMTAHSHVHWHSTILSEMARRQPRPQGASNVYSEVDGDPTAYDDAADSVAIELNPAYKAAEGDPAYSYDDTEAPLTHISSIEGAVTVETSHTSTVPWTVEVWKKNFRWQRV